MTRPLNLFAALMTTASALLLASAEVRAATVVPDAYTLAQITLNSEISRDEGTTSASIDGSLGGAYAEATASSQPIPTVSASVSANEASQALAHVFHMYWFMLEGEEGGSVPITVTSHGWVSDPATSADNNTALLYFGAPTYTELLGMACAHTGGGCTEPQSFSVESTLYVEPMKLYNLQMTLDLGASGWWNLGNLSVASGFIDPIITIDSLYADQFTLLLSEGVGNSVTPVPIPGALLLFATALGGLALVGRQRKRGKGESIAA